jgi:hypothetical protein
MVILIPKNLNKFDKNKIFWYNIIKEFREKGGF